MKVANAAVLLSGGMDSTAALWWAKERYERVAALLFDYGQPNRDHELAAAYRAAEDAGTHLNLRFALADTLPRGRGLLAGVRDHDEAHQGISPAFVPGRNLVMLTIAAAHACVMFPNGNIDLVIGACKEDAAGFPDCRAPTLAKLGEALRAGNARQIEVVAPWLNATKETILATVGTISPQALESVSRSWSCYRADGPCGACSACVLRVRAFAAAGIEDRCARAVMTGGDPGRCL